MHHLRRRLRQTRFFSKVKDKDKDNIKDKDTNLDQSSSSESLPSINFKISTKHQHFGHSDTFIAKYDIILLIRNCQRKVDDNARNFMSRYLHFD